MITELPKRIENPDLSEVIQDAETVLKQLLLIKPSTKDEIQKACDKLNQSILSALYGPNIEMLIFQNIADAIKEMTIAK